MEPNLTRRAFCASVAAMGLLSCSKKEPEEMFMRKRGRDRIAWECAVTLGVFWPWGGPTLKDPNDWSEWDVDPYSFEGTFNERMTPAVMTMLRDAGYQGFRFQIMPAPWIVAYRQKNWYQIERLNKQLDDAVRLSMEWGFGIVLCPFFTNYAGWLEQGPLHGINTPEWKELEWLWANWINLLKKYSVRRLAFETYNEPPDNSRYPEASWNHELQPHLYKLMRAHAPDHTIVVTGSDWSSKEMLMDIDPVASGFDENTIYTYHPLRPVVPVLQGFIYNQYKYTTKINYPPRPGNKSADIARMTANVNADSSLSSGEKASIIAGLTNDLNAYYDTPQDRTWIRQYLEDINDWAAGYNIPPGALYAGEYGMTRPNIGFPGIGVPGYEGGSRLDRIHIYADWSSELIIAGHRRSPIHLDTNDYGITDGVNDDIGTLDPLINRAIAPTRHQLKF